MAASMSADRCMNVSAERSATLGFPVTPPSGTTGAGVTWFTLGGVSGEMASVVTSQTVSGARGRGALRLQLEHAFRTPTGDYFATRDRAVCAPAGGSPTVCRVNDVLTITRGTGIVAGASGSLRNQGTIDFAAGTVGISIRGRVCADGPRGRRRTTERPRITQRDPRPFRYASGACEGALWCTARRGHSVAVRGRTGAPRIQRLVRP